MKLTKKTVDAARPLEGRDVMLWCGELRGFGVRIKPSGATSFIIQYRTRRGVSKRLSLGRYPPLTVDQARTMATIELGRVAQGDDPATERKVERNVQTVAELCDAYMEEARAGRIMRRGRPNKASTIKANDSRIRNHIKPLVGHMPITEFTRVDAEGMMRSIMAGKTNPDKKRRGLHRKGSAVMAMAALGVMFRFALSKGWVEHNPCREINRPAIAKRERFLRPEEYERLGKALRVAPEHGVPPVVVAAVLAMALTGCRRWEILSLQKADIDAAGRCLRLRDSKVGPQVRPCGAAALVFLREVLPAGGEYVFPSTRGFGHVTDERKAMAKIGELAGLKGLTSHILRHSFATVAGELDYSELTIAGLLGHTQGTVTAGYVHRVDYALASAADEISELIATRLGLDVKTERKAA